MNNEEVRPTANLIISTCSAYDYINNSKPNLEKLTTQYYETFSITDRFTGYFSDITIGDFYNTLSTNYYSSTAILGGLNATARNSQDENSSIITNPEQLTAGTSSITGNRGTENFGIAVFKNDKLTGKLTAIESLCHLLINNEVDSCIISINNPLFENQDTEFSEKMELQLLPRKKSKITLNIIDNKPYINIDLFVDAQIITLIKNTDYETNESLIKISDSAKKYLEKQFNNYLNKVSKDYNADIDQFSTKLLSHFSTINDFKNFNWFEKYKDSEFNIDIDINVISSMLLTKT